MRLGTDTQPNAMLLSVVPICLFFRSKLPRAIWILAFLLAVAIVLLCFNPINFNSLRDVANYVGLFTVTLGTYLAFCKYKRLNYTFFAGVNIVWFGVGIVQSFFYPKFLTFLLNGGGRGIDSAVRGVTSIATEPSQYGSISILLCVIALLNYPIRKVWWIYLLNIVNLILLSQSATATLVLLASIIVFLVVKLLLFDRSAFRYAFVALAIGLVTFQLTHKVIQEQRIYKLGVKLAENPVLFLAADGSVSERFMFVYYPFKGMLTNNLLPRGYDNFNAYMQGEFKKPRTEIESLLLSYKRYNYTRILSGTGSVIYQLGLLGFLLPIAIVMCFRHKALQNKYLFTCIALNLLLLTAFPIMTSIVGFTLGNSLYLTKTRL